MQITLRDVFDTPVIKFGILQYMMAQFTPSILPFSSSSLPSGYLSTSNVAASPSAFWFGLIAEVISAVATVQARTRSSKKSKWLKVAT